MTTENKLPAFVRDLRKKYDERKKVLEASTDGRLRELLPNMRGIPMRKPEMIRMILNKEFPSR